MVVVQAFCGNFFTFYDPRVTRLKNDRDQSLHVYTRSEQTFH